MTNEKEKRFRIEIRLTEIEKIRIQNLAKERGYSSVSHYIKDRCIYFVPAKSHSKDIINLKHQLAKIGNNINQIAKIGNSSKFISKSQIESIEEKQKTIINLIRNIEDEQRKIDSKIEIAFENLRMKVNNFNDNLGGGF